MSPCLEALGWKLLVVGQPVSRVIIDARDEVESVHVGGAAGNSSVKAELLVNFTEHTLIIFSDQRV